MKNLLRNSAWLYDVDNRDIVQDDIPFYLEYAKQQQGEIIEEYSWYDKSPPGGREIIFVCRRKI